LGSPYPYIVDLVPFAFHLYWTLEWGIERSVVWWWGGGKGGGVWLALKMAKNLLFACL